jgi:hypothetical protein
MARQTTERAKQMSDKLTEHDLYLLCYFYKESDFEMWDEWENKKHLFKKEYPHLIDAMDRLESARKTLDAIIYEIEQKC